MYYYRLQINWVFQKKNIGIIKQKNKQQIPLLQSASELYRPSDGSLLAKLVPTFADRGRHVESVTGLYGRILGFLDRAANLSSK
jgi:hypothetical protein